MANERANDGLLPMIATAGSLSAAAILGMLAYKSATRNLAKKSSSIVSNVVQSQQNQSRSIPKSKPQSNTSTSANQSTFSWSEPATSPSEVIARHQRNNNSSSVNKDNIISSFSSGKINERKQSPSINQSENIKTTEIETPIFPSSVNLDYVPDAIDMQKTLDYLNRNKISSLPLAAATPVPTSSTIQSYVPNTSLDLVNINWGRKAVDPTTNQLVFQTGTSNIVNHSGRMMTLVNINGTHMPFYLSTGQGGKAGVPAGKWYPFFGLGKEEGWINKTDESEINNYYGSDILRKISHQLDNEIGDIRGSKDVEKIYYRHSLADINKHMNPADNEKSNTKQLVRDNINQVLAKIHSNQKS